MELAVIVSLIVGTAFGYFIGFKSGSYAGMINGTRAAIDKLIDEKFLKTRKENGEIILIRYDESA